MGEHRRGEKKRLPDTLEIGKWVINLRSKTKIVHGKNTEKAKGDREVKAITAEQRAKIWMIKKGLKHLGKYSPNLYFPV